MSRLNWDRERRQRPLREGREPDLSPNDTSDTSDKRIRRNKATNAPATPPEGLVFAAEPSALLDAAVYRIFIQDWPSLHRWMLERLRAYNGAVVCRAGRRLAIAGFVPGAGDLLALHQPDLDRELLHQLGFSREHRHPFSGSWWILSMQPPVTHDYRDIAALVPQALAAASPRAIRWTFGKLVPGATG